MQTLKFEDEIDIVCENKFHPKPIVKFIFQGSSIDFGAGPQQNTTVEEDETDVERDNEKQFHNCETNPRELKPPLTHSWKNTNFDTTGSEYIFPADVDHIKKEIKVENVNEVHIEYTELPKIHEDEWRENKSHQNPFAKIVPQGSSIDFGAGPQQNTTEGKDETDVERDNEKQFREVQVKTDIDIKFIRIQDMVSDCLTKALSSEKINLNVERMKSQEGME
ncbi:hypothetical protein JTB14_023805 [Gonioctena quinquepunctata]|nr:hypothetical protein JTB14_023805 [Gonioctena quinquepunctata]